MTGFCETTPNLSQIGQKHRISGSLIICAELRVEVARGLGIEYIPAIRISDLNEADIRALIIADNRIAELAEWGPKALKAEFEYLLSVEYNLDLTGFEAPEIDFIIADSNPGYDPRSDDVPEFDETNPPVSRIGDLWLLGKQHRLLCGDALEPSAYQELLGAERAQLVFTDPPYTQRLQPLRKITAVTRSVWIFQSHIFCGG